MIAYMLSARPSELEPAKWARFDGISDGGCHKEKRKKKGNVCVCRVAPRARHSHAGA